MPEGSTPELPRVAVLVRVTDADGPALADLVADTAAQEDVVARLVVLDATTDGLALDDPAVQLVRTPGPSRGAAWATGCAAVDEPLVALALPGCRRLPTHLAQAARALQAGGELATCDLLLTRRGQAVDRANPAAMDGRPGPCFEAGLVARRETLATVQPTAFAPVELELLLRAEHVHVEEPGVLVDQDRYLAELRRSRDDAALVQLGGRPARPRPEVTVVLAGGVDQLAAYEGLCRQRLERERFEVLVLDEGPCGPSTVLTGLELPVETRVLRGPRGRNAALELARGALVLFVDGDGVAAPDLVAGHLLAHARLRGEPRAIQGLLEPATADLALGRVLQCAVDATPVRNVDPFDVDLANLSLPTSLALELGGLDEQDARPDADLALRLAARRVRITSEPGLRVGRLSAPAIGRRVARRRAAGAAALRLSVRHPALRERPELAGLDAATLDARVVAERGERVALRDGLDQLSRVDVGALERLGGDYVDAAATLVTRLERALVRLDELWFVRGVHDALGTQPAGPRQELVERDRAPTFVPRPPRLELTVVVPTRDRPRELQALLEGLARQTLAPERFEVLVVDDESSRPVTELVASDAYRYSLTLLRQAAGGPARARNLALEHARGDVVLLLNDDAVPHRELLARHLEHHRFTDRPRAVLGTFTLLPEHRRHSIGAYVEASTVLFAQPAMKPGVAYHGRSLCSGNLSVPREALQAVGGFDEGFPHAGGEDSELGLRLERALGIRVTFDPELRCEHDHALGVRSILARKRVLGWASARMQELHGDQGLLPFERWPPTEDELAAARHEVATREAEVDGFVREVEALCAAEVQAGAGPTELNQLVTPLVEAERLAFLAGVCRWLDGELPFGEPRARAAHDAAPAR